MPIFVNLKNPIPVLTPGAELIGLIIERGRGSISSKKQLQELYEAAVGAHGSEANAVTMIKAQMGKK